MKNREPDFTRLRKVLLREGEPDLLPFMELKYDHEIMEAILGRRLPRVGYSSQAERQDGDAEIVQGYYENVVELYRRMGHDYVRGRVGLDFPLSDLYAADTANLAEGHRTWRNEGMGLIANWEDFDRYPWPTPEDIDYGPLEYAERVMIEGMRIIGMTPGVLEYTTWLFGYENLCYSLYDQPDLVAAVFDRVGSLLLSAYQTMSSMAAVGALCLGDDMGHKHGTLVAPQVLRKYVFPWHKRLADAAHAHNKPFILHSDGQLSQIMDDLIEYVGIDAKHAFEDVITPVTEAKKLWGDRVAIVGGVDMDVLARRDEQYVRRYTRNIIRHCAPGGGYVLGSGNSIADYCKVENVLAMYDEGRKLGVYPL